MEGLISTLHISEGNIFEPQIFCTTICTACVSKFCHSFHLMPLVSFLNSKNNWLILKAKSLGSKNDRKRVLSCTNCHRVCEVLPRNSSNQRNLAVSRSLPKLFRKHGQLCHGQWRTMFSYKNIPPFLIEGPAISNRLRKLRSIKALSNTILIVARVHLVPFEGNSIFNNI